MNITPKPYTIAQLFAPDSKTFFLIPPFQRQYAWRLNHWEVLFDDIEDNESGYFLGSIVTIPKVKDTARSILQNEIIDGQQRLTTISLLFVAIYKKLSSFLGNGIDAKIEKIKEQIRSRLLIIDNEEIKLSLIGLNDKDYKYILNEENIYRNHVAINNVGNRQLSRASKYFYSRFENYTFEQLKGFYDKLCDCNFIALEMDSVANAYIIFETLNNRGEPLTIVDLLKVIYFRQESTISVAETKWKALLDEINSDDLLINKRFILNNYLAFIYDYKQSITNLPTKVTNNTAVSAYEQIFKSKGKNYIDELIENAAIFKKIIDPWKNQTPFFDEFLSLSRLDVSQSYMFLMSILKKQAELQLTDEYLKSILNKLIGFFVRRNLTNSPQARDVNQLFSNLSNDQELFGKTVEIDGHKTVVKKTGQEALTYILQIIDAKKASDEMVKLALLEKGIYDADKELTRIILASYHNANSTRENKKNFEQRDSEGRLVWTIEHILPETENLNDTWVMDLTNSSKVGTEEKKAALLIQQEVLHKLGNLTLTAYNSALGALPFIQKRDHKDVNGLFDGYKNGLILNDTLKDKEKWTKADIEDRNVLLSNHVVKHFK